MENLSIHYAWKRTYSADRVIPTHSHDFYEFVYYIKAKGITKIGSEKYSFNNNSFCIISPESKHSEIHNGESAVFIIGFKMDNIGKINFFSEEDAFVKSVFEKILYEAKEKKEYYLQMIYNYVQEIVYRIKRRVGGYLFEVKSPIDAAISYIDEHYLTNINFNMLASRTGYCVDRFRILFKEKVGVGPKEYILNKKLAKAKEMLTESNKMLELISFELGFVHYSRFSIFFKEKTGLSPKEYRNRYRN